MNFAPQGSVAFTASATACVWITIAVASPLAPGPLMNVLGSAKYRAAARTSPCRKASDHARITLTAAASARMPVGAGVGIAWAPEPAAGGS
jgi:hypothetical protein